MGLRERLLELAVREMLSEYGLPMDEYTTIDSHVPPRHEHSTAQGPAYFRFERGEHQIAVDSIYYENKCDILQYEAKLR